MMDTNVTPYAYDVFISYSHKDEAWVQTWLVPRLREAGLRVHIDAGFKVGVPSVVNMEDAVDASRHTVLVLTPNWVNSAWTAFESLLLQTEDPTGRRRRLLPLMLKRCTPPKRISMLTYADFTRKQQWEAELIRLIAAIRDEEVLPQPDPPPPRWPRVAGGVGALAAVALMLWYLLPGPGDAFHVVAVIPGSRLISDLPAFGDTPDPNYTLYVYHKTDTFSVDTLRQTLVFAGAPRDLDKAFARTDNVLYDGLEAYLSDVPAVFRDPLLQSYKSRREALSTASFKAGDSITVAIIRSGTPREIVATRSGIIRTDAFVTPIILERTHDTP